jgi:hypothetical protein
MISRVKQAGGTIEIYDRGGVVLATVAADDGLIAWSPMQVRIRRGIYTFAYDATGAIRRIERTDAPMVEAEPIRWAA